MKIITIDEKDGMKQVLNMNCDITLILSSEVF